jgi:pyrroline-5-carboxylate reductase
MSRLAVLGAGKLGEAILAGLLRAGRDPAQVWVSTRRPERALELADRHGVEAVSNERAATEADTLLVTVKPQDVGPLVDSFSGTRALVVSCAAGVSTAFYERRLGAVPVVRVMTNTPVLIGQAMSAISAGAHAGEAELSTVEELLAPVGRVVRVPEAQQDAVTALSGSGPAYFFYMIEAMTDAGVLLGLPRAVAAELLVQTALGAAQMLRESGQGPGRLREVVTSPGGTTAAAIRQLEAHGVRGALMDALEAARDRSAELGRALD